MKESRLIKFLYKTVIGRLILKVLVNPKVSKLSVIFLDTKASTGFMKRFINKNNIDLSFYEVPSEGFKSFNEFFTRKKRKEFIEIDNTDLICPCDGFLTISDISRDSVFNIKNTRYSVNGLLKVFKLCDEFMGGQAFIFRLTPAHYHRYNYCTNGELKARKRIEGKLHSVQPVCHEMTDVFIQNTREYVVIESDKIGRVVQMEIGALLVGKISNHKMDMGTRVNVNTEKGYFEYGGSSIVVLTKEKLPISKDILLRAGEGQEIPVKIGESLIDIKRT